MSVLGRLLLAAALPAATARKGFGALLPGRWRAERCRDEACTGIERRWEPFQVEPAATTVLE